MGGARKATVGSAPGVACRAILVGLPCAARLKAHTPRAPRDLQPCSSPLTRDARSVRKRSSRHTAKQPSMQAGPASALRSGSDTITPMPSKSRAIYSAEVEGEQQARPKCEDCCSNTLHGVFTANKQRPNASNNSFFSSTPSIVHLTIEGAEKAINPLPAPVT
eukprot:scaffold26259_cov55-Phaeocystis_antarctica.AAC.4